MLLRATRERRGIARVAAIGPWDLPVFVGVTGYLLVHYLLLQVAPTYQPSLLDEATTLALGIPALLSLRDRPAFITAALFGTYGFLLIAGALSLGNIGVPQPRSAALALILDAKIFLFTLGLAWLIGLVRDRDRLFRRIALLFLVVFLANLPFAIRDYFRSGIDAFGEALTSKNGIIQPRGLTRHQTEFAWSATMATLAGAFLYQHRRQAPYLGLALLALAFTLASLSAKEIGGCVVGLYLILRPTGKLNPATRIAFGVGFAVIVVATLYYSGLFAVLSSHISIFVGSDIETVRARVTSSSFDIATTYFPLGSGGGTFGSAPSFQQGYSFLYYTYGVAWLDGGSPQDPVFLLDVFWPRILAEGGFLGAAAYIASLVYSSAAIRKGEHNKATGLSPQRLNARYCLALFVFTLFVSAGTAVFNNEYCLLIGGLALGYSLAIRSEQVRASPSFRTTRKLRGRRRRLGPTGGWAPSTRMR